MAPLEDAKSHQRMVAIVDPPRAGLHPKAVTALRAATDIKTLVYVSCDAKAAMQVWKNFAILELWGFCSLSLL